MAHKKKTTMKRKNPRAAKRQSAYVEEDSTASLTPIPELLPVLPAKELVAFPSVMMSLYVSKAQSSKAIEIASTEDKLVFIVAQSNLNVEEAKEDDLYRVGVVANVIRTLKLPDGRYKVLLQGIIRAKAIQYKSARGYITAKIEPLMPPDTLDVSAEDAVIMNRVKENLQVLVEYEHLPEEMLLVTEEVDDPGVLADIIIAHYKLEPHKAQELLQELNAGKRLRATDAIITHDLNQFLLSERIRDKARDEMAKGQKEYYLREQIKQIQKELGEADSSSEDLAGLKQSLNESELPKHTRAEADKQLKRLERMHPEASEYALLRTYLEWLADLPWSKSTVDQLDLTKAQSILDKDHFGLEKAKERIIEFLSVRKLRPVSQGPILCFVGPPGVGKTSLGRSIASALKRKFIRISLGGVRDEAEIRGHRRTYVGALPGKIIQGMKQAGSKNPVFVLDELDKVGADFRGDPAAALLEVLDPQQNKEFQDHYLGVHFDLSESIFVATANTIDTIPEALLDRLELIFISGYTTHEKVLIAKRYLIPRQKKENGLEKVSFVFPDGALLFLIERYTQEAGVRGLEREIGSICRKLARRFAEGKKVSTTVTIPLLKSLLGTTKYDPESNEKTDAIGLVRGLAWTIHGGEIMPIEVSVAKGSGQLSLTGQLGDVMQESARAALFYARANAPALGIDQDFYSKLDIHVHVPNGATPKDGPSAGITIATALVSSLTKRRVKKDVAMTGEITLRGTILPIGGLKEKALAALRYGIKKVIIPFDNIKDLQEIPKEQRDKLSFVPVKHISEVLEIALERAEPTVKKVSKKGRRRVKASIRAAV
jgi:ATP-dependent Lon protease